MAWYIKDKPTVIKTGDGMFETRKILCFKTRAEMCKYAIRMLESGYRDTTIGSDNAILVYTEPKFDAGCQGTVLRGYRDNTYYYHTLKRGSEALNKDGTVRRL